MTFKLWMALAFVSFNGVVLYISTASRHVVFHKGNPHYFLFLKVFLNLFFPSVLGITMRNRVFFKKGGQDFRWPEMAEGKDDLTGVFFFFLSHRRIKKLAGRYRSLSSISKPLFHFSCHTKWIVNRPCRWCFRAFPI